MQELVGNPALVGVGVVTILLTVISAFLTETLMVGRTHLRILAIKDKEIDDLKQTVSGLKQENVKLTDLAFSLTGHAQLATKTAKSILGNSL